jgi:hypothetical protein
VGQGLTPSYIISGILARIKKAGHLASGAEKTNRNLLIFSFFLTWEGIFHYHAGVQHLFRTPSATGSDFQYRLFLFFFPRRWVVLTS